jgi:sugar/nucleoside kinase (ribokinase family)
VSIVTVGEAMLELRPDGTRFSTSVAGDAFNTAARLAAAGREVRHLQDLGRDALLERFRTESALRSVELVGREHAERCNGMYLVSVDEAGERRFQYHRAGSAAGETLLGTGGRALDALRSAHLVYATGVTLGISADPEQLIERLRAAPGMLALGLNIRDGLHRRAADGGLHAVSREEIATALRSAVPSARVILGSADELSQLGDGGPAERVAAELAASSAQRIVVMTDGERGAIAWCGAQVHRATSSGAATPVDTAGAGDALAAAFLDALFSGLPVEASLRAGVAAGAAAVLHRGALPPVTAG